MVGRLIEHQQSGLLHKQTRQVCSHHPAAAHLPGRSMKIRFAKAKARQNFLGLGFEQVASQFLEAGMGIAIVMVDLAGMT
jgi:hypothetical protein